MGQVLRPASQPLIPVHLHPRKIVQSQVVGDDGGLGRTEGESSLETPDDGAEYTVTVVPFLLPSQEGVREPGDHAEAPWRGLRELPTPRYSGSVGLKEDQLGVVVADQDAGRRVPARGTGRTHEPQWDRNLAKPFSNQLVTGVERRPGQSWDMRL